MPNYNMQIKKRFSNIKIISKDIIEIIAYYIPKISFCGIHLCIITLVGSFLIRLSFPNFQTNLYSDNFPKASKNISIFSSLISSLRIPFPKLNKTAPFEDSFKNLRILCNNKNNVMQTRLSYMLDIESHYNNIIV